MPAIPIAGNKPPMVVGIRQTNKATSKTTLILMPTIEPIKGKVTTTTIKVMVMIFNKIPNAISFGVF